MSSYIESLLIEREGYVRRGLKERVKQVDEVLASLGHKTKDVSTVKEVATVEVETERAASPRVSKRKG